MSAIPRMPALAVGFEPVAAAFEQALAQRAAAGAALCAYRDGELVVDLWGGDTYADDALQVVFSATKGVTAICLAALHEEGRLDVEAPVSRYWPEFAAGGKQAITVAQLFSHQAGLPGIDVELSIEQWSDGTAADVLAGQAPWWQLGTGHGYHAWTYGVLADALVRRIDGRSLGRFLSERIAGPLGAEAWIGLPAALESRVVPLIMAPAPPSGACDELAGELADPRSLSYRALRARWGGGDPSIFNDPAVHAIELPAVNGIASARGLARLYAACVSELDGRRLLGDATLDTFTRVRASGRDLITCEVNSFGVGFQRPFPRLPMLGATSFGHDGLGGALACADRESRLAFAFTTDRMPVAGTNDPSLLALLAAVVRCGGAE